MKTEIFLVLYFGLICTPGVLASDDVKRGTHPYMAFIYFSDPTIVDVTGARFIRSAVLIQPDWLITSALGPTVIDTPNGFPQKTLLARMGAVTIDTNITLNEDEDEQEEEVIQVVRPFNHSATQWWTTDISLLKTLLPFNITSAVAVKALDTKRSFDDKTCTILFYQRKYGKDNTTNEKTLKQMQVELLQPSIANCGSHFTAGTMICATDIEDQAVYGHTFCHGNSGGPLICENEVMGLQTYIDNNCQKPHLYQLISAWDNFITCSMEDKCQEAQCKNICDVKYKDPPNITETNESTPILEMELVSGTTKLETNPIATEMLSTKTTFTTKNEEDTPPEPSTDKMITEETKATTVATTTTASTTTTTTTPSSTTKMTTTTTAPPTTTETVVQKVFPKEKSQKLKDSESDPEDFEKDRKSNVQLRQHPSPKKKSSSASQRNICIVHTVLLGVIALACLN